MLTSSWSSVHGVYDFLFRTMIRCWYYIIILISPASICAQDSVVYLGGPIIIDSFNIDFSAHQQALFVQNKQPYTFHGGSFSDQLIFNGAGQVRNIGPGKVTTLSKHGLPTEHTRIYWNNISLNSPLSGIADFSLLPNFLLANKINIADQAKNNIQLHSINKSGPAFHALIEYGAFSTSNIGIIKQLKLSKSTLQFGLQHIRSENDFEYKNDMNITVRQSNSAYRQWHGSLGFKHIFNNTYSLNFDALYSIVDTEIPPSRFQRNARAYQDNQPFRSSISLRRDGRKSKTILIYGTNIESLNYIDPDINLAAKHQFNSHQFNLNYELFVSQKLKLGTDINRRIENVESTNFSHSLNQSVTKALMSIQYSPAKSILLDGKTGYINGRSINAPLQYEARVQVAWNERIQFTSVVRSLYRLPTFNELYWEPGGNQNLDPESGYSFHSNVFIRGTFLHFNLGYVLNKLKNRILWLPNQVGIFSTINIGTIGSQEIQIGISHKIQLRSSRVESRVRYTYLVPKLLSENSPNFDNDIPYQPRHQLAHRIKYIIQRNTKFSLLGKWQSDVYIDPANTNHLEGLYTLQVNVSHAIDKTRYRFTPFVQVNNITNSTYYFSTGYPQPPRHFRFGIQFSKFK